MEQQQTVGKTGDGLAVLKVMLRCSLGQVERIRRCATSIALRQACQRMDGTQTET